ncbi:hypothetical protein AAII07_21460 [Microvirga sp. 0TCS3.31]
MLRRLGGCAVALALLLPTQAVAAAPSDRTDQRAATTKTREVRLGHRPVRATTADKVRLTFKGRKGQLVNLARVDATEQCGSRVLRAGGKTVKPWAQGYWRLPRTASYTAINKPCRTQEKATVRLQVRKVVRHDAAVPGVATTTGKRARVGHLVPVRVGRDERVGLQPSSPTVEVVGPDRRTTIADASSVLRTTGRHWVVLDPESSVTTTLTVRRTAHVDGATIALPRMGTASTTQEVAFSGAAGQWVYAELLDATGALPADTGRRFRVFGPDGREVEKVVLHCPSGSSGPRCAQSGPWLLPSTGAYTMTVNATDPAAEQSATLRIRAAALAPDLTVDGPAVTYAPTSPGQWVVGRYPYTPMQWEPTDSPYAQNPLGTQVWLEASNPSPSLGAWTFTMAPDFPTSLNCTPASGQGCFMYFSEQIGPGAAPVSTPPDYGTPDAADSWALLVVPPGAQGSVDFTLRKSPEQP